jgi:rod shape-determining protein MreD
MMLFRLLLLVLAAYAAAVAETALAGTLEIHQVAPSLIALAALAWPLVLPGPHAFLGAGVIALAGDLAAPGRIGAGAAAMLAVAYAVGRLQSRARIEHYLLQVAVLAAGTFAWAIASGLLRVLCGEVPFGLPSLLRHSFLVAAYTAAVALPVLMTVAWLREPWLRRVRRLETT